MTLSALDRTQFRQLCLTLDTGDHLRPGAHAHWAVVVEAVTIRPLNDAAIHAFSTTGLRPADVMAMHGLFDAAIAMLPAASAAAWEATVDGTLSQLVIASFGLPAYSPALAA